MKNTKIKKMVILGLMLAIEIVYPGSFPSKPLL